MFARLEEQASDVLRGIRRLAHDLHPASLRLLGLGPALEAHCAEVEKSHAISVRVTSASGPAGLRPEVALCLFRIAQEALRNAIAHGRARTVRVFLTGSPEYVELAVADDGCGFDVERALRRGRGLGLVSMQDRAHAVGGELHIETGPALGATIRVRVPAVAAATASQPQDGSAQQLARREHLVAAP
jgi:signal transduction histidine kinase